MWTIGTKGYFRGFHKIVHTFTLMNETKKKGVPAVAMTGTPQRFYLLLAAIALLGFLWVNWANVFAHLVIGAHSATSERAIASFTEAPLLKCTPLFVEVT